MSDRDTELLHEIVDILRDRLYIPEWVYAKEMLPDKSGDYLIVERFESGNIYIRTAYYSTSLNGFVNYRESGLIEPEYWMPLPKPPDAAILKNSPV